MSDEIDKLVKVLGFLPAPARRQFAAAMIDLGVRVHPELPTTPNNADKLTQCVLLAKTLWFLPAPARKKFATALYDLGTRVHPELAAQPSTDGQPSWMTLVRQWAPELADKMDTALSETQREQIRAEIRAKYPQLVTEIENRHTAANYEDAR